MFPALVLCGCGGEAALPPQGQILLFIDTDAPLPAAPGSAPDAALPPPLFDRLRIEVRGESDPEGSAPRARRDFPIHRGSFASGPQSVGIVPEQSDGRLSARVRLYRSVNVRAGELAVSSSIDVTQELPGVGADGVVKVLVELHVDDVGQPQSRAEDEQPSVIPAESAAGTWPGAARVPCAAPPSKGEVCVPGGAFWMGDPALRDDDEVADAEREHLVVVSPFFLDLHEVTVGELRARADDVLRAGASLPPQWSGSDAGISEDDYSTYTAGPSSNDPSDVQATLPANAVSWRAAQAYCHAVGKELPTEVMFEFLSSGRGLEWKYVWGNDEPGECDEVVTARAGLGAYASFEGACRPPGTMGGPLSPGAGKRDRAELPGGVALDIAGNLSEWTLDWFNTEDEGVWATSGVLTDPVAREPGQAGDLRTLRGGSWRSSYVHLRAAARVGRDADTVNRAIGFRCARHP